MKFFLAGVAAFAASGAVAKYEDDSADIMGLRMLTSNVTCSDCAVGTGLCLAGLAANCCTAAKVLFVDVMTQAGYSASQMSTAGVSACPISGSCMTGGALAGITPTMDVVAAQRATICASDDACAQNIRTALAAQSDSAYKTLMFNKLGTAKDPETATDYCDTCYWRSGLSNATIATFGTYTQTFADGSACQSVGDISVTASFTIGSFNAARAAGAPGVCRAKLGCYNENSTMTANWFAPMAPPGMGAWNASNNTIPYEAYGILPTKAAFDTSAALGCASGGRTYTAAWTHAFNSQYRSVAGPGTTSSALGGAATCAGFYAAYPTTAACILGNLNLGAMNQYACAASYTLAVKALQVNSTSASVLSQVGVDQCWVSLVMGSSAWATANWANGNPGCEADSLYPTATAVSHARTTMCGSSHATNLAALRTAVAGDSHPISVALTAYLGANSTATDFCLDPTTTTTTTTVANTTAATTTAAPTATGSTTKHTTAVAFTIDLPATMTSTQKTTAKTAISTALHDGCCGPLVAGSTFTTLAACKSTAGENGVTTSMTMAWTGVLASRQRRMLAAVTASGDFELSSTDATKVTAAKTTMVAASTGGSPTLTTASLATAISSSLTTAFAADPTMNSTNFTTTVQTLAVPTTVTTVTPAAAATSGAVTLAASASALFAVVAGMLLF